MQKCTNRLHNLSWKILYQNNHGYNLTIYRPFNSQCSVVFIHAQLLMYMTHSSSNSRREVVEFFQLISILPWSHCQIQIHDFLKSMSWPKTNPKIVSSLEITIMRMYTISFQFREFVMQSSGKSSALVSIFLDLLSHAIHITYRNRQPPKAQRSF